MIPSTSYNNLHVAIIMDGNGRWAAARGKPRCHGHHAGADAVRRTVEAAPECGITTLTLYAFSSDNWKRPQREVNELMHLFGRYLHDETPRCVEKGVRIDVIGRRDRLPRKLVRTIEEAEAATAFASTLHLRIAVDYSSRDAIVAAAQQVRQRSRLRKSETRPHGATEQPQHLREFQMSLASSSRESFARALAKAVHAEGAWPDVDLLIRTGGEKRLSDFLLWESAYAEIFFVGVMWPDFTAADLKTALADFRRRERRFGALPRAAGLNGHLEATRLAKHRMQRLTRILGDL